MSAVVQTSQWARLILRLTELEPSGEVRMLAAAMALWVQEEQADAVRNGLEPSYRGTIGRSLESACMALGIDYSAFGVCLRQGWERRGLLPANRVEQQDQELAHV